MCVARRVGFARWFRRCVECCQSLFVLSFLISRVVAIACVAFVRDGICRIRPCRRTHVATTCTPIRSTCPRPQCHCAARPVHFHTQLVQGPTTTTALWQWRQAASLRQAMPAAGVAPPTFFPRWHPQHLPHDFQADQQAVKRKTPPADENGHDQNKGTSSEQEKSGKARGFCGRQHYRGTTASERIHPDQRWTR